ncbi:transcriptional regulator, MarR family [Collimonas sp. OK242]|jgi:DNA-binding MarR family transcriptional regulator|uniref:MarR family winged helix-turn-helix transcriptional regulator n=1 Tax=Collimonas sp. OK242 TaxID=1798195 RepID=UPI00089D5331|nr:MarR family transcriptional regulator [Collimonas sp. OK242]SDX81490.1 transcriptional regulator, MarR family [Collimonas sp. OK242]
MFFLKELPTRQMLEAYQKRFPDMKLDTVETALRLLRQASLLMRVLDAYFAKHDLSQLRFLILVVLDREQDCDGLMASDVAARLDVSRPVMTRTLQMLSGDGFLYFEEHDADGRAKLIQLTKKGRQVLHNVLPGYYREIENFMMTPQEENAS